MKVVAGVVVMVLAVGLGLLLIDPWGDQEPAQAQPAPTRSPTQAEPGERANAEPSRTPRPGKLSPPAADAPSATPAPAKATTPTLLAQSSFEDAEYETDGTLRIVERPDGRRTLSFAGFSTSSAPAIVVMFSQAPSGGDWGSYDDVPHQKIGPLASLTGDQSYAVPPGLDLSGFSSLVVWCDDFDVALGTAPLRLKG